MRLNVNKLEQLGFAVDIIDNHDFRKVVMACLLDNHYMSKSYASELNYMYGIDGDDEEYFMKSEFTLWNPPEIIYLKDLLHVIMVKEREHIKCIGEVFPKDKTKDFLQNSKYADVKINSL